MPVITGQCPECGREHFRDADNPICSNKKVYEHEGRKFFTRFLILIGFITYLILWYPGCFVR